MAVGLLATILNVLVLLLGCFLILLVLIQRGKGGGLSGAFGGVGGSSAFGSRAGDLFTRITLIVAGVWLVLAMVQGVVLQKVAKAQGGESGILSDE
jgi:preprotein translocase subunit SecG